MKDQCKRLTALLLSIIMLLGCAYAENNTLQQEGKTRIAIVCTLNEKWEGWGSRPNYREQLRPWLYTQLVPFMELQNAVVTNYALGKEKDGAFTADVSTRVENRKLQETADIDRVCECVLGDTDVENYAAAYANVLGKVTAVVRPEDRLEVWVIVDAAALAPDTTAIADIQQQLLTLVSDSRVNLRLLCVEGEDAAEEMLGLRQAEQLVLAAGEGLQSRIAVYTYAPKGESDLLAPVRDFYDANILAANSISWGVNNDGQLEGDLVVEEPARYMLTVPGEIQSDITITPVDPVTPDEANSTTVDETAMVGDETASGDEGNAGSEGEVSISDSQVLPTFQSYRTPYGSWAVGDIPLDCGEYKISVRCRNAEDAVNIGAYVLCDRQPMQIYWNEQLLQSTGSEETALTIHRNDNLVRIVPPVQYHEGITWHAALVMDGRLDQVIDCAKTQEGDLVCVPVLDNLYHQANMQLVLFADQPHTVYEFGPVVSTAVENRPPVAQQQNTYSRIYYNFPMEAGVEERPLKIDLSALFFDQDQDHLQFFIKKEDGSLSNDFADAVNMYNIVYQTLLYHPYQGSDNLTITIAVQDDFAVRRATAKDQPVDEVLLQTAEAFITVERVNVQDVQNGLSLQLVTEGGDMGEYDLYGLPLDPLEVRLSISDLENLDHLAQAYGYNSWQDEEFVSAFMMEAAYAPEVDRADQDGSNSLEISASEVTEQPGVAVAEQNPRTIELAPVAACTENGLEWTLELPASAEAVTYHVAHRLSFREMELPHTVDELTVRVDNTAPVLAAEETGNISCEIGGLPNRRMVQRLSEALKEQESDGIVLCTAENGEGIDVSAFFDDRETGGKLIYRLWLESEGDCVRLLDQEQNPLELQPEGYYLLDAQQSSTVIDLQLCETGLCNLRVEAFDGELSSEQTWNLQVKITSRFTRLLITAGIIAAAILLLFIIIKIIIHTCKPRFTNAVLTVEAARDLPRDETMRLDAYGKKRVPLLSVILSLQLPPVSDIGLETLSDIEIKPSKKHGMELVLGRKAREGLRLMNQNGNVEGSTAPITEEGVVLATQNSTESMIRIRKR